MEWLNYHHLLYFWTVAREGGITRAAKRLGLTQPTISGQLRSLEEALGERLLERDGRGVKLTEAGTLVYRYADEIFGLGKELQDTLRGRPSGRPSRLHVGISDSLPKLVTYRLLASGLSLDPPVQLVCENAKTDHLLANLSINGLDLVLSDEPVSSTANVRAFNHLLGESGVTFFGKAKFRKRYQPGFPESLERAPMLLPTPGEALRASLDRWFESLDVKPRVVAEFSDMGLLKVFGENGAGLFAAPTVIESEVRTTYGVDVIGRTDAIREKFYAISVERRIKHPAVASITAEARKILMA